MLGQSAGQHGETHYDYRAYGVRLRCDIPLPELVADTFSEPDITIAIGRIDGRGELALGERVVELENGTAYFALGGLGRFQIEDRKRITYDPVDGLDLSLLNLAILGPIMAILLHLRGMFILHGSALRVGTGAAMFLGDKGAGKSTTASAVVAAGYPMLTDDVLALRLGPEQNPVVVPGYPQIKLSYEAAAIVDLPAHQLIPTNFETFDKHRVRFEESFVDEPTPAGAIYILKRSNRSHARRMESGEALQAILRFSYTIRFGTVLLKGAAMADYMAKATRLASTVPVYELETCSVIEQLGQTVALVKQQSRDW